jgi:hypothetical protein
MFGYILQPSLHIFLIYNLPALVYFFIYFMNFVPTAASVASDDRSGSFREERSDISLLLQQNNRFSDSESGFGAACGRITVSNCRANAPEH